MMNLEAVDARQAKIVGPLVFGGLSLKETALILHVCEATVKSEFAPKSHSSSRGL
jgi:DNA-directed RNA polymerase specialized sigma24 family protein